MSETKFLVVKGNGTERSPYIGGSARIDMGDCPLGQDEHVRAVIEYNFSPEADGSTRVGEGYEPIVTIAQMNNLNGKIMTLVEATFSDPEQRRAMKDIFGQTIWGWYMGNMDSIGESVREAEQKAQSDKQEQ